MHQNGILLSKNDINLLLNFIFYVWESRENGEIAELHLSLNSRQALILVSTYTQHIASSIIHRQQK